MQVKHTSACLDLHALTTSTPNLSFRIEKPVQLVERGARVGAKVKACALTSLIFDQMQTKILYPFGAPESLSTSGRDVFYYGSTRSG
jgi:hypothetical protein